MFDLFWTAGFKNKEVLWQYEKDGKENLFKEVLDRQDDLEYFMLTNRHTSDFYIVDLKHGCIATCKAGEERLQPRADMLREGNYKYRFIYFREIERTFNNTFKEIGNPKIVYFLGFQYLDENKKNHKRIAKIHSDGRIIIN